MSSVVTTRAESLRAAVSPPDSHQALLARRILDYAPASVMVLVCFALAARSMASADTWWHLATGRWIAQSRAIPHTDPFSYTFSGQPWIAHEYLSDLGMYWIHHLGGFSALTILNAALLTLAFGLLYLQTDGNRWMRAAAVVLGCWAAQPGFAIRPLTVTLLLGSTFLFIACRFLHTNRVRELIWLPLLTLLWVQLHAGYMFGIAILIAIAFAEAIDTVVCRGSASRRQIFALLASAIACVAVVPLNPNGSAMLRYPFAVLGMQSNRYIREWQSPPLLLPSFYPFIALAALTLLGILFSRKPMRPGQLLMFAAFLAAALKSGRNIPLFTLISVPLLAEHARLDWAGKLISRFSITRHIKARASLAATLAFVCALFCGWQTWAGMRSQREAEWRAFPKSAVDYMVEHRLRPHLLNDYAYGGYLTWRILPEHPEYRVYIDGRADLYGDRFLLDYYEIYLGHENPDKLLRREDIHTVLLAPTSALAGLFRIKTGNHSWQIAYEDEVAVIFVSK